MVESDISAPVVSGNTVSIKTGKPCDGLTANKPFGNPPYALFATVYQSLRAAA